MYVDVEQHGADRNSETLACVFRGTIDESINHTVYTF